VDVLGRALQLGKNGELVTGVTSLRVVDFEQRGFVALNDEWPCGHP
jgi:hypothetical protein